MSQFNFANSPYEIFTQPSPFDEHLPWEMPDGAQPFDPRWHQPAEVNNEQSSEDDESSEPPPPVQTATNNQDITFTDTENLRTVLATLSNYKYGQLGSHLKNFRGVVLLPIDAVTAIRTPSSNHSMNYPCIVFYPHEEFTHYSDTLPNLVEAINILYK